jgi:CheY-like chemotaxis protein
MLAALDAVAGTNIFVLAAERAAYTLAEMLDGADADTSIFSTVDAALSAAEVSTPAVVIIDLDQHGLATASKFPGAHTVVVTSSGQRGDAARCRELGVSAYLTRPLGPLDLRDSIRGAFAVPSGTLITRHWLREQRPSLKVLVVDDSAANRMVVTQMLTVQDHEVEAVTNGLEALEAVKRAKFDLILMDMEMPEMDGLTAAKTIRLWEGKIRTPIVALTGHSSREMVQKCYDAGMDAHLTKPFEFMELADVVERISDPDRKDAAA